MRAKAGGWWVQPAYKIDIADSRSNSFLTFRGKAQKLGSTHPVVKTISASDCSGMPKVAEAVQGRSKIQTPSHIPNC